MEIDDAKPARRRGRPRSFDRDVALEQAMQLFWRQGYEATSIADLTAAMNLNPPSLYAAFGDKEHLFLEAVARYECALGGLARSLAEAPTARAAMESFLERTAEGLTETGRPSGCMLVTATMNCSAASAHLQDALRERRRSSEELLKATVRRGVKSGELPEGTDASSLAKFFMTVVQGMTIQARDGATRRALLGVARSAMRAWPEPA